jgi:membrane fusion protein, heavy metal efflux system
MRKLLKPGVVLSVLVVLGVSIVVLPTFGLSHWFAKSSESPAPLTRPSGGAELVPGSPASLRLAEDVVVKLGIQTDQVQNATRPRPLTLVGSLALDANRLARVHTRFAGEVVEVSTVPEWTAGGPNTFRQVQLGDKVQKDQLLAVVWCKDLGEKKSELVDALIHLRIDQLNLKYLQELLAKGATTEKAVREGQRNVQVREIAVAKAERTLRSWSLTDEEIHLVKGEAERIETAGIWDMEQDEKWASVDVVSPIDGTIVEKNVVEGDIVAVDSDLFKVADLSVLNAWARIYEEDIPMVHSLPKPIRWTLRLNSNPRAAPIVGTIDRIGEIIDPNEHMALLAGLVKNHPTDQLHAGQFITASIDLPAEPDVVEIPTRALVEDGDESIVFVQQSPDARRYTIRRVAVVRRHHDVVYVRSRLTERQQSQGLEEVHEGETVVAAGALELKAALQEKQAGHKSDRGD